MEELCLQVTVPLHLRGIYDDFDDENQHIYMYSKNLERYFSFKMQPFYVILWQHTKELKSWSHTNIITTLFLALIIR